MSKAIKKEVYVMIYVSHCLSAWGDRMWDFAVGLYMVVLYPDSLLLTAILGFTIALAVILFGSPLGTWIDKTKRLTSTTLAIVVQNTAVTLGSTALALTIFYRNEIQTSWNGYLQLVIYGFIILVSVIAKLASVASDVAVERDWIVVLTDGDETNLARMNSAMRTIDLTTKIFAPVAIGALISYWSHLSAAIFIAGWNVLSGFAEIYLLVLIYKRVPQLSCKDVSLDDVSRTGNALRECWGGWRQYFKHPVKLAGVGFSCLFMTVLGFDQITAGYLYSQGIGESAIGIITAGGAITGILGSISYPFLRKIIGKSATCLFGYAMNAVSLLFCAISVFMPGSPFKPSAIQNPLFVNASIAEPQILSINQIWNENESICFFIAGIVFARFGLWVADLCVAQLLQDSVQESKRGVINGVQNAINQSMDLIKFVLVILFPSSQTFGYLIIFTWLFSCMALILHAVFSLIDTSGGNYSRDILNRNQPRTADQNTTESAVFDHLIDEQTPLLVNNILLRNIK